jgi:HEAT repeat protein
MRSISAQINDLNSLFPWIRNRAINSLVEIGLPAVKEIVVALDTRWAPIVTKGFDSSKDSFSEINSATKRYLLLRDVLVKIGEPALAELENALHHSNLNVRYSAMEAIIRIGHPSIVDLLLPLVDSTEDNERGLAIAELGTIGTPRVFDRIVAALDDKSSYVRNIAIIALGNLGDKRVLPELEKIARSDKTLVDDYGQRTMGDVAQEAIDKILARENK